MKETVVREASPPYSAEICQVTIDRIGEQVIHATVHFEFTAGPINIQGSRFVRDRFQAKVSVAGARNLNEVERRAWRCLVRFANQVVATIGTANARNCISGKPKLAYINMGSSKSSHALATFTFQSGLPWETSGETMGEGSMDSVTSWDDMTVGIPREGSLQDIGAAAQDGLKVYIESLAAECGELGRRCVTIPD